MSRKDNSPNRPLNECVLGWIEKLSAHFNQPQDEDQVKIFLNALRNSTIYQVDVAFERCLNECQFMPKLADVHARMPEQKNKPENPAAFRIYFPPMVDLIRPICREIHAEYDKLDVLTKDGATAIKDINAQAMQLYYKRKGIDTSKWGKDRNV